MAAENQKEYCRCPHCRTIFRVAAEIFSQPDPWVKCGHCKKVFDCGKHQLKLAEFLAQQEEQNADSADHLESPDNTASPEGVAPSNESRSKSQDQYADIELAKPVIKAPLHQTKSQAQAQAKSSESSKRENEGDDLKDKTTDDAQAKSVNMPESTPIQSSQDNSETKTRTIEEGSENLEKKVPVQASRKEAKKPSATEVPENKESRQKSQRQETQLSMFAQTQSGSGQENLFSEDDSKKIQNKPKSKPASIAPERKVQRPNTLKQNPEPKIQAPKVAVKQPEPQPVMTAKDAIANAGILKSIKASARSVGVVRGRSNQSVGFSVWLVVILLTVLLIWQVSIVNYTKLEKTGLFSAPLNLVCKVFGCNETTLQEQQTFEILHASLRRRNDQPDVISIASSLINYSNQTQALPKIRLDLTDASDAVLASRVIDLSNSPQFITPVITQLAPGQDVKLSLDLDRPQAAAVGFKLNVLAQ